jgi:hypothetical protein
LFIHCFYNLLLPFCSSLIPCLHKDFLISIFLLCFAYQFI